MVVGGALMSVRTLTQAEVKLDVVKYVAVVFMLLQRGHI